MLCTFPSTHHNMRNRLKKPLDFGVVAVLDEQLGPMTLPDHLLKMAQVPLVNPYPNVGLFDD